MITIKNIGKILFFTLLIAVLIVPISGCTICSRTPTPTPVAAPTATPVAPTGEQTWDNGNVGAITGSAKNPTEVTFTTPVTVTYIHTYHWNSGRGVTPGTIALRGEDGTTYGPWQASGKDGMGGVKNGYWFVTPNISLKAGTYTIVDSDPSTFATNSAGNDVGFAQVKYIISA